MKTIKVIDLLNKIANGEKYSKIKFNNSIYKYHDKEHGYCRHYIDNTYTCLNTDYNLFDILNEEVEILEEKKKLPERIKSNGKEFYCDNIDSWIDKEKTSAYCEYLMNKYNDLIDYLESKEKGE